MPALRHIVDILTPGNQVDAANQIVGSPSMKLARVPCSIETVTGGEVRRGQQMQATVNRLVTMRFIDGPKAPTTDDYMIVAGQYVYLRGEKTPLRINIKAAYDPDGRRREFLVQGTSNA